MSYTAATYTHSGRFSFHMFAPVQVRFLYPTKVYPGSQLLKIRSVFEKKISIIDKSEVLN